VIDPIAGNGTGEVRGILNSGSACPWEIPPPSLFDFGSADAAVKLRRELQRDMLWELQVRPPTKLIITDIA
jgi:hypothetical protein